MFTCFLFLLTPVIQSLQCGGDFPEITQGPSSLRHLVSRNSTLAPIRITYYYYNFTLNDTGLEELFKKTLIPIVNSFLTTSLSVYPVTNNLVLRSSQCLSAVIVPEEHKTTGIPNTDIIIYITTNSLTSVSYVAYAGACETDQYGLENVLAGTVVINQKNFKDNSMDEWLANIGHEISHLLGFSQGLMQYWKNSSGLAYPSNTITKYSIVRDVNKSILITPNVVERARNAFNCSSLEGVELEDAGGSGTAGSHWDKRIMMNDYMTAYIPTDGIFSDISLALFKDTGWYEVNFALAQTPYFGRNAGCDFFNKKCIINDISVNSSMWCTSDTKWGCDFFGLNKGGCSISTYSSLPTYFQYFSYNSSLGGKDTYTDYCPYNMPLTNGRCRGSSVSTFTFTNSYEVIGSNSRCFVSTLMKKPNKVSSSTTIYAACYEVIGCNSTTVSIKIGNDTIVCPFDGSNVTLTGWNGWFKCPSNNMVCAEIPCQSFCYARGTCSGRGVCNCFSGFGGDYCNVTCTSNCQTCSLTNNCIGCIAGYSLMTDRCCPPNCNSCNISSFCNSCSTGFEISNQGKCETCIKGYYLSNGQCFLCPVNCLECNSASNCISCVNGFVNLNDRCCPYRCNFCSLTSLCTECILGHKLSSQGTCESCITGYFMNDTICVKCSSKCEECSSLTSCSICSSGYTFITNRCCPDYCLDCDSLNFCLKCSLGYALSSYGKCDSCIQGYYSSAGKCFSCIDNCVSCSSLSKCVVCSTGYINQIDRCCPNNCLYCSFSSFCSFCSYGYLLSDGKCDSCELGFYKSSDICYSCSLNCKECESSSVCNTCRDGYSLSNGNCYLNQCGNCLTCSDTYICEVCNSGYLLSTESLCDSCDSGYFNSSGICKSCASNCLSCSAEGCLTCSYPFNLLSGSCCTSSCLSCDSLSQCSKCENGFELSATWTCDVCSQGYFMSSGKCYNCASNCLSCLSMTNCLICSEAYKVDFGYCSLICPPNCQSCSTSTSCDRCFSGFTPDAFGNCVCLSGFYELDGVCYQCLSQCLTCISASVCTSCMPGYGLVSGSCLACISPCTRCTELTSCTACKTSYYLQGTSCLLCPTGCSACSSAILCSKCSTAYFLLNNLCQPCSIGCSSCTNDLICKTCNKGYYISNSQCFNCNSTCSACSSLNACTSCKSGYFLSSDSTCLSCIDFCSTCSNTTSCITCSKGYYLNNTQCLICPTGCSTCTNSTYCTACSSGYLFSSNKCLSCPSFCTKCSTTTRCTTCLTSYYLSSYKCYQCGANCLTCISSTTCSTCMTGFTLLNGICSS